MFLVSAIITLCVVIEYSARNFFANPKALSYNPGFAFGMFAASPRIVMILQGVACVVLLSAYFVEENKTARLGFAMVCGGALSNFCEKFFLGHVIDWIPSPFAFWELAFNLADVEIALGSLIAFVAVMRDK